MVLIRIIVMELMIRNVHVEMEHVRSEDNDLADSLSRMKMKQFWKDIRRKKLSIKEHPGRIPSQIWPMQKIWID